MQSHALLEEPKILIVDDMEANVLLLKKMLAMKGYKYIESLNDSRLTLPICKAFRPHLLLLDLRMPFMDGLEVMRQLKEQKETEHLPVIMITADNDRGNVLKALEIGAVDYISKPFEPAEVLMRIHNTLQSSILSKYVYEQNILLEQKVEERTKKLEQAQEEIFERLIRAIEYRDMDTGTHITRIGRHVYQMALLLGLTQREAKLYQFASKMHDIGKIGIPDNILQKATSLTEEEYNLFKLHTVKGSAILAGSDLEVLKIAEQIALTHHEKWDGTGYPHGLAGDEIPLCGRITAIFDEYDALISKRPYKEAWSRDDVLKEIKQMDGTAFDPRLIKLFFDNLPLFT